MAVGDFKRCRQSLELSVCAHLSCILVSEALPQSAVTSLMDGSVTYVDLAKTAGRYSFQPTGLHSGGKVEELKDHKKEDTVKKRRL